MEMMTAGSIWINKKGKQSRFLFATNRNLPEHIQEVYPPMAVYADENNNILSVPIVDFLSKRKFHHVEPELEQRLDTLLTEVQEDDVASQFSLDEDDSDTLLISDDDDEPAVGGTDESNVEGTEDIESVFGNVEDADEALPGLRVTYSAEGTGLPEVIETSLLSRHTEGYSQEPMIQEQKLKHTLFVRAGFGITQDTLRRSFSPSQAEINAVYTFKVMTDEGVVDVDWDTFVGVYPMTRGNQTLYQLIFTTFMQTHYELPDAIEDVQIIESEAVVTEQVVALATPTVAPQTIVAAQQTAPVAPAVAVAPAVQVAPTVAVAPAVQVAPAA
jgi:hypothetical protein